MRRLDERRNAGIPVEWLGALRRHVWHEAVPGPWARLRAALAALRVGASKD